MNVMSWISETAKNLDIHLVANTNRSSRWRGVGCWQQMY